MGDSPVTEAVNELYWTEDNYRASNLGYTKLSGAIKKIKEEWVDKMNTTKHRVNE